MGGVWRRLRQTQAEAEAEQQAAADRLRELMEAWRVANEQARACAEAALEQWEQMRLPIIMALPWIADAQTREGVEALEKLRLFWQEHNVDPLALWPTSRDVGGSAGSGTEGGS